MKAQGWERLWPQGEDGAPGSCCSLLLVVSLVQLSATDQRSETLRQGALTRLDSRIELQKKKKRKEETR